MIVDSSAIIAILCNEVDAKLFVERLSSYDNEIFISVANYLEICLRLDRDKDKYLSERFDTLIVEFEIILSPVTVAQIKLARLANIKYGRGSGSKAQLNFGDCFAYALAKDKGLPLLYKGNDFIHTDVKQYD